ncbi:MAG: HD domain-containing protein [Candidatus Hydrogenedentes bacterium]|nr:HD domain-containing protein [Candidatus Hydrogenedentota bacterium]
MSLDRLEKQIAFIKEIDKAKSIFRRNRLLDNSRYENDAEHSWHIAIMAAILVEHANEPNLDIGRVILMVLIHDLVEIGVGDTFIYDEAARATKVEQERESAERVFGMLPEGQRDHLRALWEEFEAKETSEARFAGALDRLQPLIHNASTEGHAWKKHGVTRRQVESVNSRIANGSESLWTFAKGLIAGAVKNGHLEE